MKNNSNSISSFLLSLLYIIKDNLGVLLIPVVVYGITISNFYKENVLDLESIFIDRKNKETYFVSEGSISNNKNPSVFKTDALGSFRIVFEVLQYFANSTSKPKSNAVFEGAAESIGGRGFWVAIEDSLESDGEHQYL